MPGVVTIDENSNVRDKSEEKVKKMKKKSKTSTTCITEASQEQVKVAVEIGMAFGVCSIW